MPGGPAVFCHCAITGEQAIINNKHIDGFIAEVVAGMAICFSEEVNYFSGNFYVIEMVA